jgi:hypothetical protein
MITITIELDANSAAALLRLADKFSHSDAQRYLYPHISRNIREEQCYHMVYALSACERALKEQRVSSFPWIDSGSAS